MLLVFLEGEDYSLVVSVGENCRLILDGKKVQVHLPPDRIIVLTL